MYICACIIIIDSNAYVRTYTCTYVCMYLPTVYISMYMCMYVHTHVRMYICTYLQYVYVSGFSPRRIPKYCVRNLYILLIDVFCSKTCSL